MIQWCNFIHQEKRFHESRSCDYSKQILSAVEVCHGCLSQGHWILKHFIRFKKLITTKGQEKLKAFFASSGTTSTAKTWDEYEHE